MRGWSNAVTDDRGFGTWLVRQGLLSRDDLRRALEAQRGRMGRLDTEIVDLGLLSERATLDALGKFHKTRTVSGSELEFASPAAVRTLTSRIASRLGVVPFKLEGRTLSVATLDPGDLLIEDEIAQQTGCMVATFVTLEVRFVEALHRHYRTPITARYAGLIKRLSGAWQTPTSSAARRFVDERPAERPAGDVDPIRRTVDRQRADAARAGDEVLELSTEELDLFPSLRQGVAAGDRKADDVSGEVPPAGRRSPPPPEPPEPAADELGPESLLVAASHALQHVEMRDDIADAVLGFCVPLFRRRVMLMRRKDTILGWRGEGSGVDETTVRTLRIPTDEPSVFSGLLQGVEFWLGPIPAMPHNNELVRVLGEPAPPDCYVLPVRVRDKTVCFLYGDNVDRSVGGLPLAELKRLASKASLAFQIYLMRGKIRTI